VDDLPPSSLKWLSRPRPSFPQTSFGPNLVSVPLPRCKGWIFASVQVHGFPPHSVGPFPIRLLLAAPDLSSFLNRRASIWTTTPKAPLPKSVVKSSG